jgi:hypothetical protein
VTTTTYPIFSAGYYSNFMAVWKIPLRQCPHLINNAAESNSAEMHQVSLGEGIDSSKKNINPTVQKTSALICKTVSSDRTLNDKERFVVHIAIPYVWYGLGRGC